MDGFSISTEFERFDLEVIHQFIANSYWAKGIPKETLNTSIANSLCFGVFDHQGQQVGFARMITDKATFAYLADVFILPAFRGKGLSKWLIKTILAHPDLQGLRRIMLATRDAHSLYQQFGFKRLDDPAPLMQILQPNIYAQAEEPSVESEVLLEEQG